jgi:multidrug efflux pump subunit AcrA (membrane-fusion protein)
MRHSMFQLSASWLLAGLLFGGMGCTPEEPPPPAKEIIRPVKTRLVEFNGNGGREKEFSAVAQSDESSVLSFRVSGVLQKMKVEVGDQVKAGRVVAELDKRDYILRVKDLRGQLTSAQAKLDEIAKGARTEDVRIAENKIASLESTLKTERLEYQRVQQLYANDAASKSRLEQAKNKMDKVVLDLKSANEEYVIATHGGREEEVRAQKFKVASIQSNLDQAQANLKDTRLRAPFNGEVAEKHVSNFEQVEAGQKIYTLVDLKNVEMQISVPEEWISKIKKGQPTKVIFLKYPEKVFKGWVDKVGVVADSATLTYPVYVKVRNSKGLLLPGMSTSVYLNLKGIRKPHPTVPIHAIIENPATGGQFAWIFDPETQTVRKRSIKVGKISGNEVDVVQGLKHGDQVVVAGADRLKDGMKVRTQ